MTPERWQKIEELFDAALERDAAERAAFLDEASAGDEELLRDVKSLLAHQERAGTVLDAVVGDAAQLLAEARSVLEAPERIGPYKIVREIGRGGMGGVYLAVRADDEYKKRVAIKLIRRGMDTDDILRRFRNERQILAGLDHPNIARLMDGGTTEEGLPYFVMEYIEGKPFNHYCDAHKLSTVERLNVFRTVCSAVQYAHQNLVVHRDLKPSNIVVTAEGVPKLLDFGIAKLLNPELSGQTISPTATAVRMMTPEYASPEQVRGESITTASDVYALGVLLYELLTGHRPYRVKRRTPDEIVRAVCESVPEKPSTVISHTEEVPGHDGGSPVTLTPESVSRTREGEPERLRRKLSGDLDNIVLMALRKEPERRYSSVGQFSEDIRRHLEGLPVIARKDTFAYRGQKFIRRHKVGVTAAALVVLLIIGFGVMTLFQSRRVALERDRATQERDRAAREQAKAERVSTFLGDLFKVSDPSEARGNTITAREILDKGAARIELELKDQPEVQATLMDTIGTVYFSLGLYDRAAPLLEKALQIRRQIYGNEHADVARTIHHLVDVIAERGERDRAESLTSEELAIRRKLYGPEHVEVAESLENLAFLTRAKGDIAAAEGLHREALAMRRKLLGNEHLDTATSLSDLGVLLFDQGDLVGAEALYLESLAILRKLYGADHPSVALTLNNYGSLLREKGDYAAAEATQREALAIRRKLYGEEHLDIARSLNNLASVLRAKGDSTQAEPLLNQSLAMQRKLLPGGHTLTAATLNQLGALMMERNEPRGAEPLLREARMLLQKLLGKTHLRNAGAALALGDCLAVQRRYAEAEPLLIEAYQIYKDKAGEADKRTQQALKKLASLYDSWGEAEKAAEYRALILK